MNKIEEEFRPESDERDQKKKPRSRRSRNSRDKAAEKYRDYNNQLFIEQRRQFHLQRDLEWSAYLATPSEIDPPLMKVPISSSLFLDLTGPTLEHAYSVMKVVSKPDDSLVLNTVTALQITAKIFFSQKNSQSTYNVLQMKIMKEIAENLSEGLEPLAQLIDAIGSAEVEGQKIIPECDNLLGYPLPYNVRYLNVTPPMEDPLDLIFGLGVINENGEEKFIRIPAANVLAATNVGILEVINDRHQLTQDFKDNVDNALRIHGTAMFEIHWLGIDYELLYEKYADLLNRFKRRCQHKVRPLGIKEGIGLECQLVGSTPPNRVGEVEAWSLRKISDASIKIGAALRLGRTQYHERIRNLAVVRRLVNTSQVIPHLVGTLQSR